jgi:hypothetical protein
MGMFSEIATEGTIQAIVAEIKNGLEENGGKPEVCVALKKLGRFALTQFEWSTPSWASEYAELFKEPAVTTADSAAPLKKDGNVDVIKLTLNQLPAGWHYITFANEGHSAVLRIRYLYKRFHVAFRSGDVIVSEKGTLRGPGYASLKVDLNTPIEKLLRQHFRFEG